MIQLIRELTLPEAMFMAAVPLLMFYAASRTVLRLTARPGETAKPEGSALARISRIVGLTGAILALVAAAMFAVSAMRG